MRSYRAIFLIVIAAVAAGVLISQAPRWQEQVGSAFDPVPPEQKVLAKISKVEERTKVKSYGHSSSVAITGPQDLRHLDMVEVQPRSRVEVEFPSGHQLAFMGPAQFVIESAVPNQNEGPVYLHLLLGSLELIKDGKPGGVYVLRNQELTDAKGASVQSKVYLRASPLLIGKAPVAALTEATTRADSGALSLATGADVEPSGTLSNEYIDATIAAQAEQFQRCQSNTIREQGQAKGKMLVGLTISPEGRITEARVLSSEISDEKMQNCVLQVFSRIQFRNFQGAAIVRSFPLNFE